MIGAYVHTQYILHLVACASICMLLLAAFTFLQMVFALGAKQEFFILVHKNSRPTGSVPC